MEQADLLRLVELTEAGRLTVPVAATYPLKDAAVAQIALRNGGKGTGEDRAGSGLTALGHAGLPDGIGPFLKIVRLVGNNESFAASASLLSRRPPTWQTGRR